MLCQLQNLKQVYQDWRIAQVRCLLCTARSRQKKPLCPDCAQELPWLGPHCIQCAIPLPIDGMRCLACQQQPPSFDQVLAPWRFRFPIDSLITQFKHQARWPVGLLLAQLLTEHLTQAYQQGLPRPSLLLPVPLSQQRLRARGFNQAQLLAQWLGKPLSISVEVRAIKRIHDTPSQQGLDAKARKRNLRGAFSVSQNAALHGLSVALVDDVVTTASTAQCIASVLRQAGATRVDLYCLARTPRPGE